MDVAGNFWRTVNHGTMEVNQSAIVMIHTYVVSDRDVFKKANKSQTK
jgi:hypothetical protein